MVVVVSSSQRCVYDSLPDAEAQWKALLAQPHRHVTVPSISGDGKTSPVIFGGNPVWLNTDSVVMRQVWEMARLLHPETDLPYATG